MEPLEEGVSTVLGAVAREEETFARITQSVLAADRMDIQHGFTVGSGQPVSKQTTGGWLWSRRSGRRGSGCGSGHAEL